MKRFIAVLAVVALTGTLVTVNAEEFQYGVRANFNFNFFSIDEYDSDEGAGFGAGLALKYYLMEELAMAPEISFGYRNLGGFSYRTPLIGRGNASYREMVVSIPILAQYHLHKVIPTDVIPSDKLFAVGGVQLDIPFGTKTKGTNSLGIKFDEKINSDHRSVVDFSLAFGMGYVVAPNLSGDLRLVQSLHKPLTASGLISEFKASFTSLALGVTYLL